MNFYDNQRIHNLAVGLSRASKKYFEHTSLQVRKRIATEGALLTTKLKDILFNFFSFLFIYFYCFIYIIYVTWHRDGTYVTTYFVSVETEKSRIIVSF